MGSGVQQQGIQRGQEGGTSEKRFRWGPPEFGWRKDTQGRSCRGCGSPQVDEQGTSINAKGVNSRMDAPPADILRCKATCFYCSAHCGQLNFSPKSIPPPHPPAAATGNPTLRTAHSSPPWVVAPPWLVYPHVPPPHQRQYETTIMGPSPPSNISIYTPSPSCGTVRTCRCPSPRSLLLGTWRTL